MKEIIVGKNEAGKRFDKLLERILSNANKSFIYKMLRKKNITLNGGKAVGNEILNHGDSIKIYFSDETFVKLSGTADISKITSTVKNNKTIQIGRVSKTELDNFTQRIVYEDEDVLIANKPDNMLSQKACQTDVSMNDILIEYLMKNGIITKDDMLTFTPAFVNRLDRNTSGLMIAGKSYKGLRMMSEALKDRTAQKYYLVLVWGKPKQEEHLEAFIRKDEKANQVIVSADMQQDSYKIITEYEKVWQYENLSMLKVHLITGKTHQIRAHLSYVGYPVIGDLKYGSKKINAMFKKEFGVNRQMLHSYKLILPDNLEGDLAGKIIETEVPTLFNRVKEEYIRRVK